MCFSSGGRSAKKIFRRGCKFVKEIFSFACFEKISVI